MRRHGCPDDLNGVHQMTDTSGRCVMCHAKVEAPARFAPDERYRHSARRAQDPLSVDDWDEGDYYDGFDPWDMP